MLRYVGAGDLLIVGNRDRAHEEALKAGAAVLITGGFDAEEKVKQLADEKKLPIISTSYDTFTVATMINRAIYDQLIKKEIVVVDDILTPVDRTFFMKTTDLVDKWYELNSETKHSRFPVVDENMKVYGMVTSKDIMGVDRQLPIEKVMTKNPITVNARTSVANSAHLMVWEGIELLPVVDDHNRLLGIVSRQDVLKALQVIQRQPQVGDTIDDIVTSQFSENNDGPPHSYLIKVTPQMTNHHGTISYGVFTTIVTEAGSRVLRNYKKGDLVIENLTIYFIKPVQIDTTLEIHPKVLEVGRKFGKVDVDVYQDGKNVGKALLMAQLIDR